MTNQLIKDNKGLVISIAKRYLGQGLDIEDLMQEGYMGLLLASTKFKDNMGTKFSTYASYWIRQGIKRAIENTGSLIRIPTHSNKEFTQSTSDIESSIDNSKALEYNNLVNKLKDTCTDIEFNMYMDYHIDNCSLRDISKKYAISHEKARYTLNALQAKITRLFSK